MRGIQKCNSTPAQSYWCWLLLLLPPPPLFIIAEYSILRAWSDSKIEVETDYVRWYITLTMSGSLASFFVRCCVRFHNKFIILLVVLLRLMLLMLLLVLVVVVIPALFDALHSIQINDFCCVFICCRLRLLRLFPSLPLLQLRILRILRNESHKMLWIRNRASDSESYLELLFACCVFSWNIIDFVLKLHKILNLLFASAKP